MHSIAIRRSFSAVLLVALALMSGCGQKKVESAPPTPAAPAMTGATYLRETIGSMVRVRNFQPELVSGYGLVVLPPGSGTGSSYTPSWLRQKMINDMRKHGMGSSRLRAEELSPLRVLADRDTVIVEVFGFVPAGAVPGSRFDVIVKALDEDTDATSLAGGTLWTAELAPGGANRSNLYVRPIAESRGPAYVNPFDDRADEDRDWDFRRRALVVAGGKATEARSIQLVLNQPSWTNSSLIADRINDRFGNTTDRRLIAEAQTDLLININVPERFAPDPERMIQLILHTFPRSGRGFEAAKSKQFARLIRENPGDTVIALDVMLCWQAMGRAVIPTLQEFYNDDQMELRLAALKAGAWLGDIDAGEPLADLARTGSPDVRLLAVNSLVDLPRSSDGAGALMELLNDEDDALRIAAYETLSAIGDPIIGRVLIEDEFGLKYIIDRVPSDRPLIYVTPRNYPRIAIFQPELDLHAPMYASLWDSKLMMRLEPKGEPMEQELEVYYREARGVEPKTIKAEPLVATLAYLLGHQPTKDRPQEGLNLTFGQVADALYTLCENGTIAAPIKVQSSPLARLVEEAPNQAPQQRPETNVDAPGEPTAAAGNAPAGRAETGG